MNHMFGKKFQGSYMELIVNMTATEEQENGDYKSGPLVLRAFIVDADDKFVYLGENPLQVDSFVKIEDIKYGVITDPSSFDDILVDSERDTDLN